MYMHFLSTTFEWIDQIDVDSNPPAFYTILFLRLIPARARRVASLLALFLFRSAVTVVHACLLTHRSARHLNA